jgi:urease accessory protein
MGWTGHLQLDYERRPDGRTVARDAHHGPLRVLKALYPDDSGTCHHVIVHPPGGLAGGDELRLDLRLGPGSRALVTTPGATRFYRTTGAQALQRVHLQLAEGAGLEWLPLEALAYSGCDALNEVQMDLQPRAWVLGWDLLSLGLPASDQPFAAGRYAQRLGLSGHWLEQGVIDAGDTRLLHSPVGLHGRPVLATLWLSTGSPISEAARELLRDVAEAAAANGSGSESDRSPDVIALRMGSTSPNDRVVLVRWMAQRVEPVLASARRVRQAWLQAFEASGVGPNPSPQEPRIWRL